MTDDEVLDLDELGIEPDYDETDLDPDRVQVERQWDDHRMGEDPTDTEYDYLWYDGVPVPATTVQGTDTSRFEPKTTQGPYDKDSDAIQSTFAQDNWGGGQLINKHIAGGTDQRFRSACAWTMNSEQLALPPLVERAGKDTSDRTYGADYSDPVSANTPVEVWNVATPLAIFGPGFYYAIGNRIQVALPNVLIELERAVFYADLDPVVTLPYPPVNVGKVYGPTVTVTTTAATRAKLYIPHGIGGYTQLLDDSSSSTVTTRLAVAFEVWDNRLWCLDTNGYLSYFIRSDVDTTGTWSTLNNDMRLPTDQDPVDLKVFYDRGGNQTIYIASDTQMWAYDAEVERIVATELTVPLGRANHFGFSPWRNDAMYLSSDTSVARYSRDGVKSPMGLDRDDGIDLYQMYASYPNRNILGGGDYDVQYGTKRYTRIPAAPYIGHMASSLNFLAAFVGRGAYQGADGLWRSRMSIEVFNEAGWHTIMDKTFTSRVGFLLPGQLVIEDEVGGYRIWFGMIKCGAETGLSYFDVHDSQTQANYKGDVGLYSIPIPRTEHGPRQQILRNIGSFEPDGYLYTGWFTANMEGFDKTWSHFEMYLTQPRGQDTLKGWVDVYYRTKENPMEWEFLGRAEKFGRTIMPFGVETTNGKLFSRGLSGQGIEFQYRLHSDDPTYQTSPIIETTILKYIKVPLPGRAWLLQVPLTDPNDLGNGPEEMDDMLSRKTYEGGFFPMMHLGRLHRTRVAQHQMIEGLGKNPFKQATVNLIGVEIPGWPTEEDEENSGTE